MTPLVEARGLVKHYPLRGGVLGGEVGRVHAVNGVDLTIGEGECVGLVGESGCGKTTLGKTLLRLEEPTAGELRFEGRDITRLDEAALRPLRRRMQIVFQDPYASLNPRLTVEQALAEPLRFHGIARERGERSDAIDELLSMVGLRTDVRRKFPHEFSGGQRQRIGIARALAVRPRFLLADEPVSALDVSIQAQLLNLLAELRSRLGLTYLFVSHDLKVIERFCERVEVMYLGSVVERLSTLGLHERARHPYAKALLAAVPIDDPRDRRPRPVLEGDVPSPIELPPGCPFQTRCPLAEPRCRTERPALLPLAADHLVACHLVHDGRA